MRPTQNALPRHLSDAALGLVQIPSVTGQEHAIADDFEKWALGLPALGRDDVVRHQDNLIIGLPDPRRPCVALVGHLDTVPPHPSDRLPSADPARVFGRGASDMKGGLAVMKVLFEDLKLEELPFGVILVLYSGEEGPYANSGLGHLISDLDILSAVDLAIVLESTDNVLQLGCVGVLNVKLIFQGRAGHAARPWEGDNAIHKASSFLAKIRRLPPKEVEVDGLTFHETMCVTMAQGGTATNVIPDRFEMIVNVRVPPSGYAKQVMARALTNLRQMAPEAELKVMDEAPPGQVPADNPLLEHLRHVGALPIAAKQAWTDVARLSQAGIDAANFGPGAQNQAHQAGEYITIDAMVRCYRTLKRFLETPLPRG